jgi:hypothetical protein
MAEYRIAGYALGLIFINAIFFIIYLVKSIIEIFKSKFKGLKGYILFVISFTFIIMWLKLDYEYYHFYYHLIYVAIVIGFGIVLFKTEPDYISSSKIILFLIILNLCTLCVSDYYIFEIWNSDKVAWSEEKISWEHYKQSVPEEDRASKVITTNGLQWKISKTNNTPSVIVIAFMKPSESWFLENYKTNGQLKHEQLYLDICELHARKIREIFSENKYDIDKNGTYLTLRDITDNTTHYELNSVSQEERVIRDIMSNKNEMNNSYMKTTEHGQNEEKQLEWEFIVRKKLMELAEYKR